MIYKAVEDVKEADRIYRAGLKKFPDSGALYNEYGEMFWAKNEFADAAKQWQKGIQTDPNYSGNYYNAAKYYYLSADKVWGLIYGEIFINLESYSRRTPEIKTLLLEGYKKLFADPDINKNQDSRNEFVKTFLGSMKDQSQVVAAGVSPDALSALRTRFILEWFNKTGSAIPFRLFEYQRQLAKEGLFDAYNQWIFGAANDLTAFQQWTVTHSEEYNRFNNFQKNRIFKVPQGQYYQSAK
jgi:tetratricopeptide (TPR) repeat protein